MSSETEDHHKQHLATVKILKLGGENELDRKLRLEKVVSSKHLRLDMEMEEERRERLKNDAPTKRLRFAMQTDEERKERLKKMVKKEFGFSLILDLSFKNKNFQGISSLAL